MPDAPLVDKPMVAPLASVYDSRAAAPDYPAAVSLKLNWRSAMARGRPKKNPDDVLMKSAEVIGWALGGLEREISMTRERLASLTAQASSLRSRLSKGIAAPGAQPVSDASAPGEEGGRKRRRRKMSPEARKRISEMMKKRWAERRKK
jgi:hypothetical protein